MQNKDSELEAVKRQLQDHVIDVWAKEQSIAQLDKRQKLLQQENQELRHQFEYVSRILHEKSMEVERLN